MKSDEHTRPGAVQGVDARAKDDAFLRRAIAAALVVGCITSDADTLARLFHGGVRFAPLVEANIAIIRGLMLVTACGLCFANSVRTAATRLIRAERVQRWIQVFRTGPFWYSLLPILMLAFVRQVWVWSTPEYPFWHPVAFGKIIEGALGSALLATAVVAGVTRFGKLKWLAWVVPVALGLLTTIDLLFSLHSRSRFSWLLLRSSSGALSEYGNVVSYLVGSAFILGFAWSAWMTMRLHRQGAGAFSQRVALLAILLVSSPMYIAKRVVCMPLPASFRIPIETRYAEAGRNSLDSSLHLLGELVAGPRGLRVAQLTAAEAKHVKAFRASGMVPAVDLVPAKRIILVTLESFTMTLTSRYNSRLPGLLTPTIDQLPQSMTNFRSVSMPTQFGLASHLGSHPNGVALVQTGHPNSLPSSLAAQGWITCFMQSASLQFQSGGRRYREMGYAQFFDKDQAMDDPRYRNYIANWGLCDRKVYEAALDWLDRNRHASSMLHILTADTHAPNGRTDWRGLEYPVSPEWLKQMGRSQKYLESWFRADHDLGVFLNQLRTRGLLDEHTAVVITGDHSCPLGPEYLAIPGAGEEVIERIPWILISGSGASPRDVARLSSQIDTAPTVAHLAGIRSSSGWWGSSLLADAEPKPLLAWRSNILYRIGVDGTCQTVSSTERNIGWQIETGGQERPDHASSSADSN